MTASTLGTWWRYDLKFAACARSICQKLLLGQVCNRYSMQPTYWITDTTVLTWIMLKYARPWSKSTNVRMMLPQRSRNTWRRWLRTLLSYLLIITITSLPVPGGLQVKRWDSIRNWFYWHQHWLEHAHRHPG